MAKKSLFILPFDHRVSFAKEFENTEESKQIIYQGFEKTLESGAMSKESAAILADEQYAGAIIEDAVSKGYTVCLAVEKSGQDEFDFEYGDNFGEHLNKYRPAFAKALVRYDPEGDIELNFRQRQKLKKLSDFCKNNGYQFIVEPLVPASENTTQLRLMIKMVKDLQGGGIEPDIWKIEGLENPKDYQDLLVQIKSNGRENVNAVVLGRGANDQQVEKWLLAGAGVRGVIGFAVGRTIFWQPLLDYKNKKISKEAAASQISQKYLYFYKLFIGAAKQIF
ncbi:MAG: DUF2090 domain-containing protein [Parcubacteria group bacterium]